MSMLQHSTYQNPDTTCSRTPWTWRMSLARCCVCPRHWMAGSKPSSTVAQISWSWRYSEHKSLRNTSTQRHIVRRDPKYMCVTTWYQKQRQKDCQMCEHLHKTEIF